MRRAVFGGRERRSRGRRRWGRREKQNEMRRNGRSTRPDCGAAGREGLPFGGRARPTGGTVSDCTRLLYQVGPNGPSGPALRASDIPPVGAKPAPCAVLVITLTLGEGDLTELERWVKIGPLFCSSQLSLQPNPRVDLI